MFHNSDVELGTEGREFPIDTIRTESVSKSLVRFEESSSISIGAMVHNEVPI